MVGDDVKRKRRRKITIETDQVLIIRKYGSTASACCAQCGGRLVTQEEAIAVAGVSPRVIHHWVEGGMIHFTKTLEGLLLICLDSLL
jgi:hypothetical protein